MCVRATLRGDLSSLPFGDKHAVEHHIDVTTVEPFRLAYNPFLCETQPFGNCAAACVAYGTVNLDFVQIVLLERVGNEGAARLCDDALSLHFGIDPVANLDFGILPVEAGIANRAHKTALMPDACL